MTQRDASSPTEPSRIPSSVQSSTVQILVANEGNRRALRDMLSDEFDVETDESIRDADLYLVEDRLLSTYREELREQVSRSHPVFCPVVIIERDQTSRNVEWTDTRDDERGEEGPLLVDEFVEAPMNKRRLVSRLRSLLVRRQQSLELQAQVDTLERQERDLRRFERAVEDGGTATAITDTEGVIEYVNSEFEELTGYVDSEALGRSLERFLTDESSETIGESFWQTMAQKREWEGELLVESKNDQRRITDASITPITDNAGETEGFVVVMPDITQRIEQEQLLRDRERELDLLRQILSRYLRHNLRNDLNVILGYGKILKEKLPEEDVPDATKIVAMANRLIESSETARKYSRLIEQESALAPRNVAAIVDGVASDARREYPDVSIDTETPDSCHVLARAGIEEAIRELIDNAARHNTADSPWVRVTVTESDGVQIVIEDNGPGISELELETLDQESETALTHSQGIGLWLSKWVIERSDGRLSFDTTETGGTRVTIDFPPVDQVGTKGAAISDLKAREQRLETITQRMTDAVLEVNASWKITYVDEQAENILGVDADAIRGRPFWEVFSAARDTRFETVYREVMRSRSPKTIEEYYDGIDGWLEVYVYPDFDGGISFYFRDVTDRNERERKLALARSRMELALEVTDAVVWEWEVGTDVVTMHPEQDPVFETTIRTLDEFIEVIHPDDRAEVEAALDEAVETGSPYDVEFRLRTDETVRWVADYGEVQYDADGDPERVVGVARDITEYKAREAELELKSRAMDEAPTGITISDPGRDDNPMIYINDEFARLTGYSKAESIGRNCRFLQGENTDPERVAAMREAIDAGDPVTVELRNYRKDGTEFWNRVSISPVRSADGEITHFVGFQQDVTETKESEQYRQRVSQIASATDTSADQKIERLLDLGRQLLGMENAHVAAIDRSRERHTIRYAAGSDLVTSGMVRDLSETFCRRTIETDDILAIDKTDTTETVTDSTDTDEQIGCYVGTKLFVEDELFGTVCFADQEPRDVSVSDPAKPLIDLIGRWIGHILQSKRQREQREAIFNRMTDALFSVDNDWRITYVNEAATDVLNRTVETAYSSEEFVGRQLWEVLPELLDTRFEAAYREAMDTQESVTLREYYDPLDTWFETRVYPSKSGLSVYFRDITEEHEREAEIRERERTLREMYELIADTSRSFDEQVRGLLEIGKNVIGAEYGSLSQVRGEAYTFEIVDAPAGTISSGDVVDLSATYCERAVATEKTVVLADVASDPEASERAGHTEWGIDCYIGTPVFVDGEVYGTFCFYSEAARTEPFSEWEVTLVDLMGRWISYELDHQRTERELRGRNDQLERLASVLSHDLRNPLRVAEGNLELARETCSAEHHDRIGDALDRMDELIDDILTLAQGGSEIDDTEWIDLGELTESSWGNVAADRATLLIETDATVEAARPRLKQLLENLLANAVEHGGEDVTITVGTLETGFYIADDGPGIPEDERSAVFETGYSTSEGGTGFGLSIVRRIVEAHGWEIRVTDGADGGARFEITGVEIDPD